MLDSRRACTRTTQVSMVILTLCLEPFPGQLSDSAGDTMCSLAHSVAAACHRDPRNASSCTCRAGAFILRPPERCRLEHANYASYAYYAPRMRMHSNYASKRQRSVWQHDVSVRRARQATWPLRGMAQHAAHAGTHGARELWVGVVPHLAAVQRFILDAGSLPLPALRGAHRHSRQKVTATPPPQSPNRALTRV